MATTSKGEKKKRKKKRSTKPPDGGSSEASDEMLVATQPNFLNTHESSSGQPKPSTSKQGLKNFAQDIPPSTEAESSESLSDDRETGSQPLHSSEGSSTDKILSATAPSFPEKSEGSTEDELDIAQTAPLYLLTTKGQSSSGTGPQCSQSISEDPSGEFEYMVSTQMPKTSSKPKNKASTQKHHSSSDDGEYEYQVSHQISTTKKVRATLPRNAKKRPLKKASKAPPGGSTLHSLDDGYSPGSGSNSGSNSGSGSSPGLDHGSMPASTDDYNYYYEESTSMASTRKTTTCATTKVGSDYYYYYYDDTEAPTTKGSRK